MSGDANSTLASALTAVKMHLKVAHVEAGARSYDTRMPEEITNLYFPIAVIGMPSECS